MITPYVMLAVATILPLVANIPRCFRGILNDARIISRDPALRGNFEILYAYPGFWALFWYRLSHALLEQRILLVSDILPRLAMSLVRYATAIDIHPGAQISSDGILIDHGAGLVIGETAVVGGQVTLYHGVTLGNSGKKLPNGAKRHPTIGDRVVVGAGAKILGDVLVGDDSLVGANSVVTKSVPSNHTAVGVPARLLCHGAATGKDVAGAAICELHKRLQKVEEEAKEAVRTKTSTLAGQEPSTTRDESQTAGEGREKSSLGKRSVLEFVPVKLPSPRENKLLPQFAVPGGGQKTSDEGRRRVVLEEVYVPQEGSSYAKDTSLMAEATESAVGEILYSLRVLGEPATA